MKLRQLLLPLIAVFPAFAAIGCGSGPSGPADSMASNEQQVQNMVAARKIFDEASDKNYDNLPADRKTEFDKLVGGSKEARRWWNEMVAPRGGSAAPGGSGRDRTQGP